MRAHIEIDNPLIVGDLVINALVTSNPHNFTGWSHQALKRVTSSNGFRLQLRPRIILLVSGFVRQCRLSRNGVDPSAAARGRNDELALSVNQHAADRGAVVARNDGERRFTR